MRCYLLVLGLVAGSTALRFLLDPLLGQTAPLLLFPLAIVAAGLWCGLRHALLATGLSAAVGWFLFIEPRYSFTITNAQDAFRLLIFAGAGSGIAVMSGRLQRSRAEIQSSEERFRLLVEGSTDLAIFALDPSGRIESWNAGAERINGYTAEEAVGRHYTIFFTPEQQAAAKPEQLLRLAEEQGASGEESWRVRKDGTTFRAEATLTALRDSSGKLRGFSHITRDVTQRYRQQTELERSEETTRALLECASQAILGFDSNGCIRIANAMTERLFGYHRSEILGLRISELLPEGTKASVEGTARRRDGSEFPAQIVISEVATRYGSLRVAFLSDITDRKQFEQRLRQSELHTRRVLDSLFVFVGVLTPEGTLIEANRGPLDAAGITKEDVIGRPFWDTPWWSYSPAVQEQLKLAVARAAAGESSRYDVDLRMRDGELMPIDFTIEPMRDDDGRITHLIPSGVPIAERKRMEEALRRSEAQNRRLVESGIVGILHWDLDGRVVGANDAFLQMIGYTREDLEQGRIDWKSMTPPEWAEADARGVEQMLERGTMDAFEKEYIRKDGSRVAVLLTAASFDSEPRRGVTIALDVTARRQAERAMRASDERFRAVFEGAAVGIARVGLEDGQWLEVNEAFSRMLGYTREEMQAIRWPSVTHPDDLSADLEPFRRMAAGELAAYTVEKRFIHKEGHLVWARLSLSLMRDADGRPAYEIAVIEDITARVEAEAALRRSEALFRGIFDNAAVGMAQVTMDGRWIAVNQRLCDIIGYTREEMLARTFMDVTHPDDLEPDLAHVRQLLAGESQMYSLEKRYIRKDGQAVWVNLTVSLQRDGAGAPERFVSVVEDITARKQTESALRETEDRYRMVMRATNDVIWDWNLLTDRLDWNPSIYDRFGYKPGEVSPESHWWPDHIHPDDRHRVQTGIRQVIDGTGDHWVDEYRFCLADGSYADILDRGYVVRDSRGRALRMIGSMLDLTPQKHAAAALRESEARFRAVAEAAPALVWLCTPDGAVVYMNRGWYEYTGLSEQESLGLNWTRAVHPDDLQPALVAWEEARRHEAQYEVELRYRRRDGSYRWHVARALLGRDASGTPTMWFGMSADIEDQKRIEQELRRANEDLEQFAYAASHDLQEPLRMVVTFTQLLARRYENVLDEGGRDYVRFAVEGAQRIEALLAGLREYWRVSERSEQRSVVDLHHAAAEAIGNLRTAIEEAGAKVTVDALPSVVAEYTPMVQLFQNLVGNAVKYRCPGREASVHIGASRYGAEWRIWVEDNGIGIKPEYRDQVFGIFKRLHARDEYPGTGIGLALCQTIVERHGGTIWVESQPGVGSRFYFTLPV